MGRWIVLAALALAVAHPVFGQDGQPTGEDSEAFIRELERELAEYEAIGFAPHYDGFNHVSMRLMPKKHPGGSLFGRHFSLGEGYVGDGFGVPASRFDSAIHHNLDGLGERDQIRFQLVNRRPRDLQADPFGYSATVAVSIDLPDSHDLVETELRVGPNTISTLETRRTLHGVEIMRWGESTGMKTGSRQAGLTIWASVDGRSTEVFKAHTTGELQFVDLDDDGDREIAVWEHVKFGPNPTADHGIHLALCIDGVFTWNGETYVEAPIELTREYVRDSALRRETQYVDVLSDKLTADRRFWVYANRLLGTIEDCLYWGLNDIANELTRKYVPEILNATGDKFYRPQYLVSAWKDGEAARNATSEDDDAD